MVVVEERVHIGRQGVRRGPFVRGPAVPPAPLHEVDFLMGRPSHVVGIEAPGRAVDAQLERVAKSERPHGARRPLHGIRPGIVGRNRTVGIDAQDLPVRGAQVARDVPQLLVPRPDVQLPVGAHREAAPGVRPLVRIRKVGRSSKTASPGRAVSPEAVSADTRLRKGCAAV